MEPNENASREGPFITVTSPNTIAVFGGAVSGFKTSDGFIFDTRKDSIEPILGDENDVKLYSATQVLQVGPKEFVTVGCDIDDQEIKMIKMKVSPSNGKPLQTRIIHGYGRPDDQADCKI